MKKLKRFNCKAKNCPLKKSCKNIPYEIVLNDKKRKKIDVMFVGEAPGVNENIKGMPFIGNSGKLFRNILSYLHKDKNFKKINYIITNMVKGFPSKDRKTARKPTQEEVNNCFHILEAEVKKYKPKIIVALGTTAYDNLVKEKKTNFMSLEEGTIRESKFDGIKIIGSYHPSFCLRNEPCSPGLIYYAILKAFYYVKTEYTFLIPSNNVKTRVITSVKDVISLTDKMKNHEIICIDTETQNLNRIYGNKIISIQFCFDGKVGNVVVLDHLYSPLVPKEKEKVKKVLSSFFKESNNLFIFHNAIFDVHQITREFKSLPYLNKIYDTSFSAFLLNENLVRMQDIYPSGKGAFSLFTQAYKVGFNKYLEEEKFSKDIRTEISKLPLEKWVDYASADVIVPFHLYFIQNKLAKISRYDLFKKMSVDLNTRICKSIVYIEQCGIPTNIETIRKLYSPRLSPIIKDIENIKKEFMFCDSVKKFNILFSKKKYGTSQTLFGDSVGVNYFDPNSKIHREILFFKILGLSSVKQDGKLSVDKEFQKQYKDVKEVQLLSRWNRLQKLKTSYIDNIYNYMDKTKGNPDFYTDYRVRPTFRPNAVTGRLTSQNPNGQQIVSRGDGVETILSMFEASEGKCIVKMDYSAVEVRGLCLVSKDKSLSKSFNEMHRLKTLFRKNWRKLLPSKENLIQKAKEDLKKENKKPSKKEIIRFLKDRNWLFEKAKENLKFYADIHRRSASIFFNVPLEKVTKEQRQNAKGFVFGSIYGRGEKSIAQELGITEEQAKEIKQKFMNSMPEATKWLNDIQKEGFRNKFVVSPIGRKRHLFGFFQDFNNVIVSKMNRLCANSIIQGFCSDLNLIGVSILIDYIYNYLKKGKYQVDEKEAWMITNIVHDSIEMEVPIKDVIKCFYIMEDVFTKKLVEYVESNYDFKFNVPIEIDIEAGIFLSNKKKWLGTKRNALEIKKWLKEQDKQRRN